MKLNSANARRLASLSALGGGALVTGVGQAAVVYTTLPLGKVGFSTGFNASFATNNAAFGGVGFKFDRSSFTTVQSTSVRRYGRNVLFSGHGGAKFAVYGSSTSGGFLHLFKSGSTMGTANRVPNGAAAVRGWERISARTTSGTSIRTTHHAFPASFSNEYALFTFTFDGNPYYGWVELSLNNQNVFGTPAGAGPDLTISAWAFQEGTPLPAGDTGIVPEPATLATTALAALVLGAVGVRRWRSSRRAPAA